MENNYDAIWESMKNAGPDEDDKQPINELDIDTDDPDAARLEAEGEFDREQDRELSSQAPRTLEFNNAGHELYMRVDGQFYRVGFIAADEADANAFMDEHEDMALIDTDQNGLHYIAAESATVSEGIHWPDQDMSDEDLARARAKITTELHKDMGMPPKTLSVFLSDEDGKFHLIGSIMRGDEGLFNQSKAGFSDYQDAMDAMKDYGYEQFNKPAVIGEATKVHDRDEAELAKLARMNRPTAEQQARIGTLVKRKYAKDSKPWVEESAVKEYDDHYESGDHYNGHVNKTASDSIAKQAESMNPQVAIGEFQSKNEEIIQSMISKYGVVAFFDAVYTGLGLADASEGHEDLMRLIGYVNADAPADEVHTDFDGVMVGNGVEEAVTTAKDYNKLAGMIKGSSTVEDLGKKIMAWLPATNRDGKFDRVRFAKAAGLSESTIQERGYIKGDHIKIAGVLKSIPNNRELVQTFVNFFAADSRVNRGRFNKDRFISAALSEAKKVKVVHRSLQSRNAVTTGAGPGVCGALANIDRLTWDDSKVTCKDCLKKMQRTGKKK